MGDQADVLGKHREQAAFQEVADLLRAVAGLLQGLGKECQPVGYLSGCLGAVLGWVEGVRVGPHQPQPFADSFVPQVGQQDAMGAGVGKR